MRELPPYTGPRWEPRDIPPWIQAFLIALALTGFTHRTSQATSK